ncbi:uncharacterized protein K02A2.6-like [Patella vulgata]|uniref:uncharacterized protein K02A2.6-like n=1 Tax=Patella vulgata TaxID=6465 RepID=UPI0024A96BEA|nr:uncharacterized protein K02A2.6-like [Patella vulgata]
MKAVARQYFWWPKINEEIEKITKHCKMCQENAPMPASPDVASWNWPSSPWKRLHLDFAGPFLGYYFLIVVDSYSKWLEVIQMKSITTTSTVKELRKLFSTFGTPEHIVTDNGTQYTSSEFFEFLFANDIKHTRTAPAHPATNGMAERYVGYFKKQMKKMADDRRSLEEKICGFLLSYRTTPHSATGESPCYLLMHRQLRTRFSSLRPSLSFRKECDVYDRNTVFSPLFKVGDPVYVLNLRSGPRWLPGIIIDVKQRSYDVQVYQQVWKRHEDQLRKRSLELKDKSPELLDTTLTSNTLGRQFNSNPDGLLRGIPTRQTNKTNINTDINKPILSEVQNPPDQPIVTERRYPERIRRVPDRYK